MLNGVERQHNQRLNQVRQIVEAIKLNLIVSKRPVQLEETLLNTIEDHLKEIRRLLAERNS